MFSHHDFFLKLPDLLHPAGLVGHEQNSLLVVVLTLQYLSVRFVMICGVAGCCFDIFSHMGLVTVARQRDQKLCLFAHVLFCC